jgi:hypothetical protein
MKTTSLLLPALLLSLNIIHAQTPNTAPDGSRPLSEAEFGPKKEPFYLPNKLVKPPVYAWDKPKDLYSVNAASGGSITHKSGTRIHIPPGAFVDETGNKVEGEVQIDYREFKDPVDFIFSGIPMTYDSGGVVNNFQSAGMFEITASQEGRQVYLASDKKVNMDFVSTDSSTSYNFYVLDEKRGNWVNKGKTQQPVVTSSAPRSQVFFSTAVSACLNHRNQQKNIWLYDTTSFAERNADTAYYYTWRKHPTQLISNNNNMAHCSMYNWNNHYRSMIRLSRLTTGKKGETAFTLKLTGREFPEMQAFSGKTWVLTDHETPSSFRRKYGYRNAFCDLRLEEDGDGYAMTLKSTKGFVTLHAYPVSPNQLHQKEHPALNTSRNLRYYTRTFNRREIHFNRMVAKDKKLNNKNYVPEEKFWASQQGNMTPYERGLNYEQWTAHCDSFLSTEKNNVLASAAGEQMIIRSLQLDGMGVFNCDQVSRLQNPVAASARYKTGSGQPIQSKSTYIIDNKINGILRYDGIGLFSPSRIVYSPGSENRLIAIRQDGTVAFSDPQAFKKSTDVNQKEPEFTVAVADPKKMSVDEFRQLIGLK